MATLSDHSTLLCVLQNCTATSPLLHGLRPNTNTRYLPGESNKWKVDAPLLGLETTPHE